MNTQIEELKSNLQAASEEVYRVMAERDQLKARVAELERDKERLDWLIKQGPPGAQECSFGFSDDAWLLATCELNEFTHTDGECIRKAIDAAMKEGK